MSLLYDLPQDPIIVDLDLEIERVPPLPCCDQCSTAYRPQLFQTYADLSKHRRERHSSYSVGPDQQPINDLYIDTTVVTEETLELWLRELADILNIPPDSRGIAEVRGSKTARLKPDICLIA